MPNNPFGIAIDMVWSIAVVVLMVIARGVSMCISVIGMCMDVSVIYVRMVMGLKTGMHVNVVRMVMPT
jgi:hypothetical protein